MRSDGRDVDALRPVTLQRNYTRFAPGSVLACFGDTQVLCTAILEDQVPAWLRQSGKGWVTAEYAMLPGSSAQRIRRDAYTKGRSQEISRLIGRSLRAVTDLDAMGPCQITVDCDVLQADGGTRTAAITGAYVALHDALSQSVARGFLKSLPLRGACAGVSVGVVRGVPMLDLCYEEDSAAEVDMNLVMDAQGRFIEVQGSAEGAPFSGEDLARMLALGRVGCAALLQAQQKALADA